MATITNRNGQLATLDGRDAVEAFRLKMIISGIKAEKLGMRLTRGANCTKLARELTGLKTRDRDALIVAMQALLAAQVERCEIVTDDTVEQTAAVIQ